MTPEHHPEMRCFCDAVRVLLRLSWLAHRACRWPKGLVSYVRDRYPVKWIDREWQIVLIRRVDLITIMWLMKKQREQKRRSPMKDVSSVERLGGHEACGYARRPLIGRCWPLGDGVVFGCASF
jgi:hypothetical protein